jgi:hypothetical protein
VKGEEWRILLFWGVLFPRCQIEVREYLKNILNLEFDNFIRCNVMVIPDIVDYIRYFKQGLVSNKLIK